MLSRFSRGLAVLAFLLIPVLVGCSSEGSEGGEKSTSSADAKVEAVRDDFRVSVRETVKATGLAENQFKYQSGQVYDASELEGDLEGFVGACGDNGAGYKYDYSAPIEGDKKYSADEWEPQSEKIRAKWESLGWEVKNVAPGTKDAPGITIGASTPAGVTVLYSVSEGGVDYIDISSPCSDEIPAPSSSAL